MITRTAWKIGLLCSITARLLTGAVILELTPPAVVGLAGTTVTINGMLTNAGEEEVFLNGNVIEFSYAGFSVDDSLFFINAPLSLPPGGGGYKGPLFQIVIDPGAPQGNYLGSFTVQGGPDENTFADLARQSFELDVSPVPEPGSLSLVVLTSLALLLGRTASGALRGRNRP